MYFRWAKSPRNIRCLLLVFLCTVLITLFVQKHRRASVQQHTRNDVSLRIRNLLVQELKRFLRKTIPSVEDVGEAFMDEWFKREEEFCKEISRNKSSPFHATDCLASCQYEKQWLNIPIHLRRNLIVIPFRDRLEHLKKLVPRIEQILKAQNICYLIVIAEQSGTDPFNKGTLMNAAFAESVSQFPFHCVTLHDVDLLPLSEKTPYTCSTFPRHTSVLIDKFENRLPYVELIGGILTIPVKMYLHVNGFSNIYWAWGAEDDDMYERLAVNKIPVQRADPNVARFHMLQHRQSPAFPIELRSHILSFSNSRHRLDGLNSLNFTVVEKRDYFATIFNFDQKPAKSILTPNTLHQSHNNPKRIVHLLLDIGRPPQWLLQNKVDKL